jgi:PAS domain S-box-containing protein
MANDSGNHPRIGADAGLTVDREVSREKAAGMTIRVAVAVILAATLVVWFALLRYDNNRLQQELRLRAERLSERVGAGFQERAAALDRMAHRWEYAGGTPKAAWQADATTLIDHLPGFLAIEWVDAGGRVRWVVPPAGNERIVGLKLNNDPIRRKALEQARLERRMTISGVVTLVQDGRGFLLYRPLFVGPRFDGFLVGVFRADALFSNLIGHNVRDGYTAVVLNGSEPLYRHTAGVQKVQQTGQTDTVPLSQLGADWRLNLRESVQSLASERSYLPWVVLASGFLAASLVGIALWFWKVAVQRAREATYSNAALRHSETRLNLALDGSGLALWDWDITTGEVYLSRHWGAIIGGPTEPTITSINALTEITHPDDRAAVREAIVAAFKSADAVYRIDHRVRSRNGDWRWIQSNGRVVARDTDGRALRMTGTNADITKRRAVDDALRRQQEALRALNEIAALTEIDTREQLRKALAVGSQYLELDYGIVSHIEGDLYTVLTQVSPPGTLHDGQTFYLGHTYCSLAFYSSDLLAISHAGGSSYASHPCYEALALESYIGMVVQVSGERYGTVNFSSPRRRARDFDQADMDFVRLLARWVTSVLERDRSLQMLYSTMEMQRGILDGANYSIISTSPDGVIRTFNRAAERMLGYQAGEVIGKVTPEVIHDPHEVAARAAVLSEELGEDIEPGFEVFVAKARRGLVEETEWNYLAKDGRRIPVLLSVTALRDAQGSISGFLGIASDISARKQAEQDLGRFKNVLDNTVDMIFMFEPESLRFVYLNRGAVDSMGYAREELLQMTPYDVKPLLPEPEFRRLIAPLISGERAALAFETLHRRKDDSEFPVEILLQLVRDPGTKGLFVSVVRDVTERKKMERMKSEFVSTVSHELRTPLTSIRGSLGLVASGVAGPLPHKARQLIDIAYKNSGRLAHLVNDILDVEKIESGKMHYDMKPEDLMSIVDQALETIRGYGQELGIEFVLTEVLDGARVNVDAHRLLQVLANLLSNAAKFSPRGQKVEVAVRRHGPMVRVSVTDHGAGVPPEFHDRIFERFSQADASDSRRLGGSGLGLHISKSIVDKFGGQIGFETTTGSGSTFFFDLPEIAGKRTRSVIGAES